MGDVGKRSAMYVGRRVLSGLHQIGIQGVAQQHGDGTCHAEVLHLEVLAVGGDAQHDVLDAALQVFLAGGQTENGHQFRCRRDVETRLGYHAVATQSCHHVTQGTVVHVEHALPEYLT